MNSNQKITKFNPATVKTMTSTQLAEMLHMEKKEINRAIRKMFQDKIDEGKILSLKDSRGYVSEYILDIKEIVFFISKKSNDVLMKIISLFSENSKELKEILDAIKNIDIEELPKEYFVYIAREEISKRIKVGISKDPIERVKQLNTGNPEKLILVEYFKANYGFKSERNAHEAIAEHHIRSEWFNADADYNKIKDVV